MMVVLNKENDNLSTIYIPSALISILILNVVIYIIIKWKDKNNIVMLENILLKQEKEMEEKHIFHVEELHEQAKTLRHDLKQYSECIYTLAENIDFRNSFDSNFEAIENLKKYVSNTRENIRKIEYAEITGNPAVDSVINYKVGVARKNNINVNLALSYKIQNVSDVDISILLGNLIDNAIEACVNLKNIYNEKKINITIYKKKAYVVISIANTIQDSVLKNNPKFITTKENKDIHGLGMKSIKNILEKYNGLIDNFEENGMLTIKIMLVEE